MGNVGQILASNRRLDEVFDDYAVAAAELIEFNRMTLAWLEPNGCSIFTLRAGPSAADPQATTVSDFATNIRSKLQFGQHDIGTLTLWRRRVRAFTPEDAAILERLGSQVSAKVQYHRLYHLAKHQACQLGQLQQTSTSAGQVDGLAGPSNDISDITSRPDSGQALPRLENIRKFDSLSQELLVDAAHALRSPLSSIKGYSSTLLLSAGIPQIKPTFLEIAPSGIPSNIIPHSKGVKCGLIRSNSPFSYSNHRPAKPKIPKPLVYAQVSPLGTSFATP